MYIQKELLVLTTYNHMLECYGILSLLIIKTNISNLLIQKKKLLHAHLLVVVGKHGLMAL